MVASANQLHVEITADCTNAVEKLEATKSAIRALNGESAAISVDMRGAQDAADSMDSVRQARERAGGTVKLGVDSEGMDEAQQKLGAYRNQVQGLTRDLEPLGKTDLAVTVDSGSLRRVSDDMGDFSRQAERSRTAVRGMADAVGAAGDRNDEYSRSARAVEQSARALTSANSEAERSFTGVGDRAGTATSRVSAHEQAMSRLGATVGRSAGQMEASSGGVATMTRELEQYDAAASRATASAERFASAASSQPSAPRPGTGGGGPPLTPPPSKGYGGAGGDEGEDPLERLFQEPAREPSPEAERARAEATEQARTQKLAQDKADLAARDQRAKDALSRNKAANDARPGLNQWEADRQAARASQVPGPSYSPGAIAAGDDPAADRAKAESRFSRDDERQRAAAEKVEREWQATKDASEVGRAAREEVAQGSGMQARGPGGGPPTGDDWNRWGASRGDAPPPGWGGRGRGESEGEGGGLGGRFGPAGMMLMGGLVSGAASMISGMVGLEAMKETIKNVPGLALETKLAMGQLSRGIYESGERAVESGNNAETMGRLFNQLGNAMRPLGAEVGTVGADVLPSGLRALTELSQQATSTLHNLAPLLPSAVTDLGEVGSSLLKGFGSPASVAGQANVIRAFGQPGTQAGISDVVAGVVNAGAPLAAAVGDIANTLGDVLGDKPGTSDKIAGALTSAGAAGYAGYKLAGKSKLGGLAGAGIGALTDYQQAEGQDTTAGLMTALGGVGVAKGLGVTSRGKMGAIGLAADAATTAIPDKGIRSAVQDVIQDAGVGGAVGGLPGLLAGALAGVSESTLPPYGESLRTPGVVTPMGIGAQGMPTDAFDKTPPAKGGPTGPPAPKGPKALPIPDVDKGVLEAPGGTVATPQGLFRGRKGEGGSVAYENQFTGGGSSTYESTPGGISRLHEVTPGMGGGYSDLTTTQLPSGDQYITGGTYGPQGGFTPGNQFIPHEDPQAAALPWTQQQPLWKQAQKDARKDEGLAPLKGAGGGGRQQPLLVQNPDGTYTIPKGWTTSGGGAGSGIGQMGAGGSAITMGAGPLPRPPEQRPSDVGSGGGGGLVGGTPFGTPSVGAPPSQDDPEKRIPLSPHNVFNTQDKEPNQTHQFDRSMAYYGPLAEATGWHTFNPNEPFTPEVDPVTGRETKGYFGDKEEWDSQRSWMEANKGWVEANRDSKTPPAMPQGPQGVAGIGPGSGARGVPDLGMSASRATPQVQDLTSAVGTANTGLGRMSQNALSVTTGVQAAAQAQQQQQAQQEQATQGHAALNSAVNQTQNTAQQAASTIGDMGAGAGTAASSFGAAAAQATQAASAGMAVAASISGGAGAAAASLGMAAAAQGASAAGGAAQASSYAGGLSSGKGEAAAAGKGVAEAGKGGAEDGQDSHSPAREFMKLGVFASKGYALGMNQSMGVVSSSARSMGTGAVNAAAEAVVSAQAAYNTALAGGFGAGITAASNGVTPIASTAGLMLGYVWAKNVATGAMSVLQSSQFSQLTMPKLGSQQAMTALGALGLLPPAGSGAEYYNISAGSAGMVTMKPEVNATINVMVDGAPMRVIAQNVVNASMTNLADLVPAQRG